jgi:FkbM family methyltransferase
MDLNRINYESNILWAKDNGNFTHSINYNIDENSVVIDLGGYRGLWADVIIDKYNPYIVLVEPIPEFYEFLKNKFKDNSKVTVLNYGISDTLKKGELFLNGDGTSKYNVNDKSISVDFIDIEHLLKIINRDKIDLMQINIEGEEFNLLNNMINTGSVLKFKNIQIQFHTFVEDAMNRRIILQNRLSENNFIKLYDYPFVFEGWSLKN